MHCQYHNGVTNRNHPVFPFYSQYRRHEDVNPTKNARYIGTESYRRSCDKATPCNYRRCPSVNGFRLLVCGTCLSKVIIRGGEASLLDSNLSKSAFSVFTKVHYPSSTVGDTVKSSFTTLLHTSSWMSLDKIFSPINCFSFATFHTNAIIPLK